MKKSSHLERVLNEKDSLYRSLTKLSSGNRAFSLEVLGEPFERSGAIITVSPLRPIYLPEIALD